ncbi:hypothetical protein L3Q82_017587 [Scortum barcoo]|uniref:Uncharacterized protein n=1 Tax=Scortum barcoo TaxID=214431 RepID=A0ACB8VLF2_9TELE|nr:hypothetical protein L3Q82_017587 [Scortum barcoo]
MVANYFSAKLDPVAAGHPRCLHAVAAAEKALLASRDIVGYAHVTLLVPHVCIWCGFMILGHCGNRNFFKSDGKLILHHSKITALLDAILLPKAISVCKCAADTCL